MYVKIAFWRLHLQGGPKVLQGNIFYRNIKTKRDKCNKLSIHIPTTVSNMETTSMLENTSVFADAGLESSGNFVHRGTQAVAGKFASVLWENAVQRLQSSVKVKTDLGYQDPTHRTVEEVKVDRVGRSS